MTDLDRYHDQALFDDRLRGLDDDELRDECGKYIFLSAYAANNARSAFHWMVDATFSECRRRGKEEIYTTAHRSEMRKVGYR